MCSFKAKRMITLISTEAKHVALLVCAQEVKFLNMLLEDIYEVQKPTIIH